MTIRFLDLHIGNNWLEFWIGYEVNEGWYEVKVDLLIYKFWVSLPIRWTREI